MPILIAEHKEVRARVAHRCSICGAIAVRPGETYTRSVYVQDESAYTWIRCVECDEITPFVWDMCWPDLYDEGIGLEEYDEWASEHTTDPIHGQAARAFRRRIGVFDGKDQMHE